jgi:hypothetical protein
VPSLEDFAASSSIADRRNAAAAHLAKKNPYQSDDIDDSTADAS